MNLPPLTAEVSLYQSNGHYRTNAGTGPVRSSTRGITRIYPTQSEITSTLVGNEIITVHGTVPAECPPGFEPQGTQCVPIGGPTLTFTNGGGTQGGGSGSGAQPPPGWKLCPGEATEAQQNACSEWVVDKIGGGKVGGGKIMCDEKGKVYCCIQDGEGSWRCLPPSSLPRGRRLPPTVAVAASDVFEQ